jgi:hypothetical protein
MDLLQKSIKLLPTFVTTFGVPGLPTQGRWKKRVTNHQAHRQSGIFRLRCAGRAGRHDPKSRRQPLVTATPRGLFAARKATAIHPAKAKIAGVQLDDIIIGNGVSELIVMAMEALFEQWR